MISFVRRVLLGEPAVGSKGAQQKRMVENEAKLRDWGFGSQRTADSCRRRLQRLCQFLLDLDQEDAEKPGKSDIRKLKAAFEKSKSREESRSRRIRRLRDLRAVLSTLVRRKEDTADTYFKRLKGWSPEVALGHRWKRREALKKSLRTLQILSQNDLKPGERPLDCFESLLEDLKTFESRSTDDVRGRLRQSFEDCVDDWEWAYLQVLTRLAGQLLEEDSSSEAAEYLEEAIERFEDKELLQARWQGLYGSLAGTCLARARDAKTAPDESLDFLHKALTYAQHAVEMEPESVRERLKLIEVFSVIGDDEEMKAEAEIALNLDSSSDTLKTVGRSFWDRISSLRDRKQRRKVLREATQFFGDALALVESDRFDSKSPLEQLEAHGWAHFWLGRFQCERGLYDEGTIHLKTARSLGFKPLESRLELAWAYLLARDHTQADRAFGDVIGEAGRLRKPDRPVMKAPGEERRIADLELDAWLGWALLWAERDPVKAAEKITNAESLLPSIERPNEEDLRAALHEARGLAYLREEKKREDALKELDAAVRLIPRSGAYCALASVSLEQARTDEKGRADALRKAKEAYRLARETDVRGRHRRELADLRLQLREMEKPAPKPASAAAPPTTPPKP